LIRSLARQREILGRRNVSCFDALFAGSPAAIRPPPVDCQPPRHPDEPGFEPIAIPKLREAPVRFRERLLGNILGILPVPQHAVGDAERQGRRLAKAILELSFEILVQGHESPGIPARPLIHSGSSSKTAWIVRRFSRAGS
jgi:hypothetical protein